MASGVYRIVNTLTGDFYIGSSANVDHRLGRHRWMLLRDEHPNSHLLNAWRRDGAESFVFELIERVDPVHLLESEQAFIDQLRPRYNIAMKADRPPGTLGLRWKVPNKVGHPTSEETKEKLRQAGLGRTHSLQTKLRISALKKGRITGPPSAEHRRKISEAKMGSKRPPCTEEARRNLSVALMGKRKSPEHCEHIRQAKLGKKLTVEAIAKRTASRRRNKDGWKWIGDARRGKTYVDLYGPERAAEINIKKRLAMRAHKESRLSGVAS